VARISLYAKLSHGKRMNKIEAVLPRTLAYLGEPFQPLTSPFLAAYPPFSANRYDNAKQFFQFLVRRWGGRPQARPYLLDLARYELAVADARTQPWVKTPPEPAQIDGFSMVRRSPSVSLIRCRYDIRPLLDGDEITGLPDKRELFLAIVFPRGATTHRVFEIGDGLAGLLSGLTDWQKFDPKNGAIEQLLDLELVDGR